MLNLSTDRILQTHQASEITEICFCVTLPLRKNLLGSKRKAINIYFAEICFVIQGHPTFLGKFGTANSKSLRFLTCHR